MWASRYRSQACLSVIPPAGDTELAAQPRHLLAIQ
jgi:hypothetical protein